MLPVYLSRLSVKTYKQRPFLSELILLLPEQQADVFEGFTNASTLVCVYLQINC